MQIKFQRKNFYIAIFLFCLELYIALFVKDKFIRPYLGDLLVVILIYYFVQSFFEIKVRVAAFGVWIFAICIEILQYFNTIEVLGWQNSSIAKSIIGTTFSWEDIIAYTIGILIVLFLERKKL